MNLYRITLTYLNIESGGSTEYKHTYNLWAPNYGTAIAWLEVHHSEVKEQEV